MNINYEHSNIDNFDKLSSVTNAELKYEKACKKGDAYSKLTSLVNSLVQRTIFFVSTGEFFETEAIKAAKSILDATTNIDENTVDSEISKIAGDLELVNKIDRLHFVDSKSQEIFHEVKAKINLRLDTILLCNPQENQAVAYSSRQKIQIVKQLVLQKATDSLHTILSDTHMEGLIENHLKYAEGTDPGGKPAVAEYAELLDDLSHSNFSSLKALEAAASKAEQILQKIPPKNQEIAIETEIKSFSDAQPYEAVIGDILKNENQYYEFIKKEGKIEFGKVIPEPPQWSPIKENDAKEKMKLLGDTRKENVLKNGQIFTRFGESIRTAKDDRYVGLCKFYLKQFKKNILLEARLTNALIDQEEYFKKNPNAIFEILKKFKNGTFLNKNAQQLQKVLKISQKRSGKSICPIQKLVITSLTEGGRIQDKKLICNEKELKFFTLTGLLKHTGIKIEKSRTKEELDVKEAREVAAKQPNQDHFQNIGDLYYDWNRLNTLQAQTMLTKIGMDISEATQALDYLDSFKRELGKEYHIKKSDANPPLKCSINIAKNGDVFFLLKQRPWVNDCYKMYSKGGFKTVEKVLAIKTDGTTEIMVNGAIDLTAQAKIICAASYGIWDKEQALKWLPNTPDEVIKYAKELIEREAIIEKEEARLEIERTARFTGLVNVDHITVYISSQKNEKDNPLTAGHKILNVPMILAKGDLANKELQKQVCATAQSRQKFIGQLITQLIAIHKDTVEDPSGLKHKDIKPSNLLLDQDGNVIITDFGLADLASNFSSSAGTPRYIAPELAIYNADSADPDYYKKPIGPESQKEDVWALGCTIFEILTGKLTPYMEKGEGINEHAQLIYQGEYIKNVMKNLGYSSKLTNLITQMLEVDISKRSSQEIDASKRLSSQEAKAMFDKMDTQDFERNLSV